MVPGRVCSRHIAERAQRVPDAVCMPPFPDAAAAAEPAAELRQRDLTLTREGLKESSDLKIW